MGRLDPPRFLAPSLKTKQTPYGQNLRNRGTVRTSDTVPGGPSVDRRRLSLAFHHLERSRRLLESYLCHSFLCPTPILRRWHSVIVSSDVQVNNNKKKGNGWRQDKYTFVKPKFKNIDRQDPGPLTLPRECRSCWGSFSAGCYLCSGRELESGEQDP